ncbi:MAG: thymidylate synthase (FAD) [Deltaproteobacteria bacterium]|nr:MAG: thymidylate synthase (FAD) [Deltaproteobacteria bacterium]
MEKSRALIVEHTEKPSNLCFAAAKISTSKGSAMEIYMDSMEKEDTSLVAKVLGMGHHSISEHAFFTVVFDNVSVIVEQFIIEFRLASFTVKSRRYVDYKKMGWVVPDLRFKSSLSDGEKEKIIDEYNECMDSLFSAYSKLTELGIPKEDARFILPYSFRSNFYCTLNARELMKIIYSACYGRGASYPEIKKLGFELLGQAENIFKEPFSMLQKIAGFKDELPSFMDKKLAQYKKQAMLPLKNVELLSATKNASFVVVSSQIIAQTGISSDEAYEIIEKHPDIYKEIIDRIVEDGRPRALENISFGFRINRITLAGLTHLVRHRIQSIIVPELFRGVRFNDFILPDSIKNNPDGLKIYESAYKKHIDIFNLFRKKIEADADCAYFALAGMRLDVVTSMNARQLFHFFRLRTCMRAQWEIRALAYEMLSILRVEEPDIFGKVGPGCFMDGKCPEGKFTCGKMQEVRDFISTL